MGSDDEMTRLAGKGAVIIGGAGRIGRAVGKAFAESGAGVMLVDRREPELAAAAEACGGCPTLAADIGTMEDCRRVADEAARQLGCVDVLVNCPGGIYRSPFLDHSVDALGDLWNVNVRVPFMTSQVFGNMMKQNGEGKIINFASVGGTRPEAGHSGYSAAKAGLIAFSRVAAMELAAYNIQVNVVAPGPTETIPFTSPFYTQHPEVLKSIETRTPAGRIGHPEDHVGLVVFLASDESDWVTGQVILCDGGFGLV
jgi:NAD(P)-dependent dehydrogenase (short-subunit alcohol dehydrogenase family)